MVVQKIIGRNGKLNNFREKIPGRQKGIERGTSKGMSLPRRGDYISACYESNCLGCKIPHS